MLQDHRQSCHLLLRMAPLCRFLVIELFDNSFSNLPIQFLASFPIPEPGHELQNGQRVLSVEFALPSHNLHLGHALQFDGAQRTYSGFPLAYSWSRGANSHRSGSRESQARLECKIGTGIGICASHLKSRSALSSPCERASTTGHEVPAVA